ncbi:hypothetical protein BaRGS_00014871 [Batillaria attramentaria]|uniref:Cyclic nucleotide-binding domain-containing protein n=1 Tax=Batillaria attramentaria TaxID=370345 RepID=A0ABD0L4E3_9CAEN
MSFEIPPGLTDLLQEFTVAVLRERPADLVTFAASYFCKLSDKKQPDRTDKRGGVRFIEEHGSEDEPMHTESEEEDFEPPPVSARSRRKSAEGYDPEADEDEASAEPTVVYPKTDEQRARLNDAVKHILLFRSLDEELMQEVLDAMFERQVKPGDHVIDQGDDGDNFYVIDQGKFDIYVEVDGKPKLVGNYENKGFFGELALMYNMPRAATIVATSDGVLWALDRNTFRRIVLKTAFLKRRAYEGLLESVPMLKTLDLYERMNVADALQSKTFEDGQQIIRQGDSADCMYFVEDGEVRITMVDKPEEEEDDNPIIDSVGENDPSSGKQVEVTTVKKGGYFGALDVQAFERLMGPCMDIMKRNINEYEDQLATIFGQKVNMDDLR